jgi:hypothetical protein
MNNKIKYKMWFLQGDMGGGSGGEGAPSGAGETLGGAAFTPPAKTTTGDRPLPPDKLDSKIGEHDPQQPAAAAPSQFDPEKFTKEFSTSVAEALKGTVAPQAPALTKEEAQKILNVWQPDDAWYMQFDNLETRKDAIASMRDGLVRHADTVAQLRLQEAIAELRKEYDPKLSFVEEHNNMQRETRFHETFPQLKNPGLQPLIGAITEDLIKQGKTFTTEGEMFKAVASGVEAVIKATNPEFTLETAGASPANNGRNANAIPVTTPGSGGGMGRSTAAPKTASKRGLSIFD